MALFEKKEEACLDADVVQHASTAVVYDQAESIASIEGTPWYVTYYSQALGRDDAPRQLDFGLDPSLQQYAKINNYIIAISSALNLSNDESSIATISGDGIGYPGIVPNVGDHFVAEMSDGTNGVFVLTSVTRMSYLTTSAWTIEYELFDHYDSAYEKEFDRKTVRTNDFDATLGLISQEASKNTVSVVTLFNQLLDTFYDEYYDLMTLTALYPNSTKRIYDSELVIFMTRLIDTEMRAQRPRFNVYETPTGHYRKSFRTVWDALLDGDTFGIKRAMRYSKLEPSCSFSSSNVSNSIAMSPIEHVIFPSEENTLQSSGISAESDAYVFTAAFYENDEINMTPLEKAVREALCCEIPDIDLIRDEANKFISNSKKENFYFIPVLLWLIVIYLKRI